MRTALRSTSNGSRGVRELLRLLRCEWIKLKHAKFLFVGLSGTLIVPFFVIVKAVIQSFSHTGGTVSLFTLYDNALMFLMLLFAPMVLTILDAWIISREYTDGTLKNILAVPVSKTAFLWGKLLFCAIAALLFMLISWLEIFVLALLCGCFIPVTELTIPSLLYFLLKMLFGGGLLCATQLPFIYFTIRSKGFVLPLVAVSAISLINVVLSNSPIAGFYPWSAAYLLVTGRLAGQAPGGVSLWIILTVGFLGIAASLVRWKREEIR